MNERDIFIEAIEIESPQDRQTFLVQACESDTSLRARVEALLLAHDKGNSFLESPPAVTPDATIDQLISEKPGTRIGPYKLLEQIGEGGMGVVYVASQREPLCRTVALKIIKPGMDTREVVTRFAAERQALALMDHPNIAKVFDAGATDAGRPYFVMELVKGTPVTEFCDQHQLATRQRLELFVALCHGVQHAHQKGVIHRDLKPSNVLVEVHDVRPVPKIIDFGIAKAVGQHLTEQSLHTGLSQMVGTPLYMSPEQAGQSRVDVDTRSDIYSLGVVLYELLTGHTPFERDALRTAGVDEMRRIIREVDPPRPSARVSTLAAADLSTIAERHQTEPRKLSQQLCGELDWIVMKAMDKDRDRRYETANGLAADVERYLDDKPVEACPPSAAYRFTKFARRNKLAITATTLVALALVMGSGVATWQSWLAMQARDLAERQQGRAEKNFGRAMDAVDQMLTQVGDKDLADVPQLEPIRRILLERALAFYQGLQDENDSNPKARHETGLAHCRSGDILALMGKLDDAEKEFHQAITTLTALAAEFPEDPAYANDLARTHNMLGKMFADSRRVQEAEQELTVAVKAQEALVAKHPKEPEYQSTLGLITVSLASLLWTTSRSPETATLLRDALERQEQLVLDHPQTSKYRETLGRLKNQMARYEEGAGHYPEAEKSSRSAIELFQQLVKQSPETREYRYRLANCQDKLAMLLENLGRHDEAIAVCREALESGRQRVRDFPYIPAYRNALGGEYGNLACHLETIGRYEEAEKALGEAMLIFKQLVDEFPKLPEYRSRWALAYNNLARLLKTAGRFDEAKKAHLAALEIRQQLAKDYPTVPDYRCALGDSYFNLSVDGRNQEAEELNRQAHKVYQQLVADFPSVAHYRRRLANSGNGLGGELRNLKRNEEAEQSYRQAIDDIEPLAQAPNALPDDRKMLVEFHVNLGALLSAVHRDLESLEIFRATLELAKKLAADFPQVPKYRLCLGVCYYNFGSMSGNNRDEKEAAYRAAIGVFETLLAVHPTSEDFCRSYHSAYHELGHLLKDSGRLEEARDCWNKEVALLEALIKDFPTNEDYPRSLADVHKELTTLDKPIAQKEVERSPDSAAAHHP